MTHYWHMIGNWPQGSQFAWDLLLERGLVTAGYGNTPTGRGYSKLSKYKAGDCIWAYVKGHGAIGYAIVPANSFYSLVDETERPDHRHQRTVHWVAGFTDVRHGIDPMRLRRDFGLTHPRSIAVKMPQDGAERLRAVLPGFAPEQALHDELPEGGNYIEGTAKRVLVNAYERSREARKECIQEKGEDCIICGFNFAAAYGEVGRSVIHVHHIRPLHSIAETYKVSPIDDLVPICPNCHVIVHRRGSAAAPYSIEEVKAMIQARAPIQDLPWTSI